MQTLNGVWKIATDPENKGREKRWFDRIQPAAQSVPVPGIIQQAFPAYHGVAWYWHTFGAVRRISAGNRALLRFGAVDYLCDVWVNGRHVGGHEGGETPFEVDLTRALRRTGRNLLAVRVLNPSHEPIDGIVLKHIPSRHKAIPHRCGSSYNHGGIVGKVELAIVPAVRIADVFVRPNLATGDVRISVTVRNDSSKAARGRLVASIAPALSGAAFAESGLTAALPCGDSVHEMTLHVKNPQAWSLEDPFLYLVTARLEVAGAKTKSCDQRAVRCGFRDFRVIDGYFHLNGKRIFLKSSHTIDHYPMGQIVPVDPDLLRRDLIMAKASGFNMIRWIAGLAWPEQMDVCDEIGLMVYEESYAAWCLEDSPDMARRYDLSTREMVLRDRNHPSVTIWGMLNETSEGPVFRHAMKALKLVRSLDETRLAVLGSGRWDCDPSIGSVSNPGSRRWERVWGGEAKDATRASNKWSREAGGYFEKVGDVHAYPRVPHSQETIEFLRTLGKNTKPVFLSEYGIGSQMNVIEESRCCQQAGARSDLEDVALLRSMAKRLESDWKRLGMQDVYPFAEDMLLESQRLHSRQRLVGFDAIRSNPDLCGFNLTGLLDHSITGEGLWTYFRRWKPGVADALSDGWAPLRWCLFVTPLHAYTGRKITIEAVLANEEALLPGRYRVRLSVFGPSGNVWRKNVVLKVPAPAKGAPVPLALPVFKGELKLKGPAGQYTFAAEMDGAAPAGGRLDFHLSDPVEAVTTKDKLTLWGINGKTQRWLERHGFQCRDFTESQPRQREIILVGDLSKLKTEPAQWQQLASQMARGSVAVFLSPKAFKKGDNNVHWLPLKKKGRCRHFTDWLYHREWVAKRHPIFEGLRGPGVMDWNYYGEVVGYHHFEGQQTPDDVAAATFTTANGNFPGGYGSGILMGAYKFKHGRFVLNALDVLENLNKHPAADRLLVNLVRYAGEFARGPMAKLPARFDKLLADLNYARP